MRKLLILHGLGETPADWEPVCDGLEISDLVIPHLGDLCGGWENFTVEKCADALAELLTALKAERPQGTHGSGGPTGDAELTRGAEPERGTGEPTRDTAEPVDVCGLSLGAVVGLVLAVRHPHLVHSLFLSAPQFKPSRALLFAQRAAMSVLPERVVTREGMTKEQLLRVLDSVFNLDLESDLPKILAPATLVCGIRDRPNMKATSQAAALMPNAQFSFIAGAGHQWQVAEPQRFADTVRNHLKIIEQRHV